MALAQTVLEKFHPMPFEAAFSTVFRDNFQPEVDSDVIYGADVKQVGMDVHVKLGDFRSDRSQDI